MSRDLASILSVLASKFESRVANQIQRSAVLPQLLEVKPGKGKNLQWVAKLGTATGAIIADGADVTVFNSDDKKPAILQYAEYHDAFAVTGRALSGAKASGNPEELATLFLEELGDSVERLAKIISQDMWTGDGDSDTLHGLLDDAGGVSASGVYASIDRAIDPQWASNEIDAETTVALSFSLMRQMRSAIYTASGLKPDLIVCSPDVHEQYGNLFQSERRYLSQVRLRGGEITLDGGYGILEFDGIPVVEDPDCPANTMVFLNTRHVYTSQMGDSVSMINRALSMTGLKGTEEEQFGVGGIPLTAKIQPLAITGHAYKFALYCMLQICVKRPNACGKIINLKA
ncbi:MAG: phage major capsid protein [Gammaproteobacteria bacterium]|nr:phage major capsid protein [Gammaproteobacteria bacterium]